VMLPCHGVVALRCQRHIAGFRGWMRLLDMSLIHEQWYVVSVPDESVMLLSLAGTAWLTKNSKTPPQSATAMIVGVFVPSYSRAAGRKIVLKLNRPSPSSSATRRPNALQVRCSKVMNMFRCRVRRISILLYCLRSIEIVALD
jgi:hypothetical protein